MHEIILYNESKLLIEQIYEKHKDNKDFQNIIEEIRDLNKTEEPEFDKNEKRKEIIKNFNKEINELVSFIDKKIGFIYNQYKNNENYKGIFEEIEKLNNNQLNQVEKHNQKIYIIKIYETQKNKDLINKKI